jgi:hypothetical protein
VLENIIGGIDEGEAPPGIVLQAEGETDDTESETGSDHYYMVRPQGPHDPIVEKTES